MGTKQELIDVALTEFGIRGFDGVGTRELAEKANTAMSSITYHFGSKKGLYLACADFVADQLSAVFASVPTLMSDCKTKDDGFKLCREILTTMAKSMTSVKSRSWSSFIAREQQNPTEAFEIISSRMFDPMIERFYHCVVLCRPDLSPSQVKALSAFLVGMPITLRYSHAGIARQFGQRNIDGALRDLLIEQLHDVIARVLDAPQR